MSVLLVLDTNVIVSAAFDGAEATRTTRLLTPERVADLTVRGVLATRPRVRTPWIVRVTWRGRPSS